MCSENQPISLTVINFRGYVIMVFFVTLGLYVHIIFSALFPILDPHLMHTIYL